LLLKNENTAIFVTDNVKEAERIVRKETIHLALLDYMMTGFNGDQVAKRIYKINPDIKIVFITGYETAIDAVKKLDIPVHGVFMKPICPELMINIVESEDFSYLTHTYSKPSLNVYYNLGVFAETRAWQGLLAKNEKQL
ncbi:unnamed protein product, partial [marine sediment metagenome]